MVEDDGAVGPAVMVDQTQIGEKTHTNSLQASLVTEGESITLDLQRQRGEDEVCRGVRSAVRLPKKLSNLQFGDITHEALVSNIV